MKSTYLSLCKTAEKISKNAYAPYSGCFVGAALLTKTNKVYTGVNIENASFPAGICAERSAFCSAISDNEREFEAIAIAGGKGEKFSPDFMPCGICRQFISEFVSNDFKILICDDKGYKEYTLSELLPRSFKGSEVKK